MLRPRPTGRPLVLLVDDAHHLSLDDDALKDDALDGFGHGRLVLLLRGDRAADGRARAAEAQVRRRRGATEPSAWNSKSSGRLPPCLRCSSCIRAGWLCRFTTKSV